MKTFLLALLLVGCAEPTKPVAKQVPDDLTYCMLATHKPRSLPSIVTKDGMLRAYNAVELSREKILQQLRECDLKRKALIDFYKGP